jgi:guanine deaminase
MQTVAGPLLNPRAGGEVNYIADGALACDAAGVIAYVGPRSGLSTQAAALARQSRGLILPPFLDAHIHIPQHPIRGRFMEGVGDHPPQGRLLAGLNRNVFPTEAKCADDEHTRATVQAFLRDTLSKGVIGGAAYMTVHPRAVRIALDLLPESWSVGLVLMNMNCPEYLRTNEATLEDDIRALAADFGNRLIVTDRFAVSVNTPLRTKAAKLAAELGLRMQTHLNEQIPEKRFVEEVLYPTYESYTDVYLRDGLLDRRPILAHCVRMSEDEFKTVKHSTAVIAHCPTSNTLLGSGVMPLSRVQDFGIPYAICTDVGASPTTSLLAEMAQFLKVHQLAGPDAPTPSEALSRSTLAPAQMLQLAQSAASFELGNPMSFIEVAADNLPPGATADEAIQLGVLEISEQSLAQFRTGPHVDAVRQLRDTGLDHGEALTLLEADTRQTATRLDNKVLAVTISGQEVFRR